MSTVVRALRRLLRAVRPGTGPLATVLALTAGALALRVIGLGRLPLWRDEAFRLLQVTDRPFADWLVDVHPPLYYALLLAWFQVSSTDAGLRLPSAVLGAMTVPAVYALGARLLGRAEGLWGATFLAATWLHVWHSREARRAAPAPPLSGGAPREGMVGPGLTGASPRGIRVARRGRGERGGRP